MFDLNSPRSEEEEPEAQPHFVVASSDSEDDNDDESAYSAPPAANSHAAASLAGPQRAATVHSTSVGSAGSCDGGVQDGRAVALSVPPAAAPGGSTARADAMAPSAGGARLAGGARVAHAPVADTAAAEQRKATLDLERLLLVARLQGRQPSSHPVGIPVISVCWSNSGK